MDVVLVGMLLVHTDARRKQAEDHQRTSIPVAECLGLLYDKWILRSPSLNLYLSLSDVCLSARIHHHIVTDIKDNLTILRS